MAWVLLDLDMRGWRRWRRRGAGGAGGGAGPEALEAAVVPPSRKGGRVAEGGRGIIQRPQKKEEAEIEHRL